MSSIHTGHRWGGCSFGILTLMPKSKCFASPALKPPFRKRTDLREDTCLSLDPRKRDLPNACDACAKELLFKQWALRRKTVFGHRSAFGFRTTPFTCWPRWRNRGWNACRRWASALFLFAHDCKYYTVLCIWYVSVGCLGTVEKSQVALVRGRGHPCPKCSYVCFSAPRQAFQLLARSWHEPHMLTQLGKKRSL